LGFACSAVMVCACLPSFHSRTYSSISSIPFATCSANLAPMHDFTERFTVRFCELPYDVSTTVAAAGLRLLAALVRMGEVPTEKVRDVYR